MNQYYPLSQYPEVFLLDIEHHVQDGLPSVSMLPNSEDILRRYILQITMHILLDNVPVAPGQITPDNLCNIISRHAVDDLVHFQYLYTPEAYIQLRQWYTSTYMRLASELSNFFPHANQLAEGIPYTVQQYGSLLQFNRVTIYPRDFVYVASKGRTS